MKVKKFFEFVESDFDAIKSFYVKDELNAKVWNGMDIDVDIKDQLIKIGTEAYEETDLPSEIIDIILCGSLCGYNWSTRYSDYDLHVIIDYKKIDDEYDKARMISDYAKKNWNKEHDIKIKGFDVEIMFQDENDLKEAMDSGKMGGAFSLLNNKWVKTPSKIDFVPDEEAIKEKATPIMERIDDIEKKVSDGVEYNDIKDELKKVWEKIKNFRKSGLESKDTELSIGNLVFKLLRRNGYINTILEIKNKSYDNQFK